MRFLRRLRHFYNWRRYGICPIHLELARRGGGYSPKWICSKCDFENTWKHEDRGRKYDALRLEKLKKMREAAKEQLCI